MAAPDKAAGAFRTIGELSRETGIAQHVLRYWEGRFTQLRPLQRAGNRRYYRPEDVALVRRIQTLLERDGYTVRGVQQLLAGEGGDKRGADRSHADKSGADRRGRMRLIDIRDDLAQALDSDAR